LLHVLGQTRVQTASDGEEAIRAVEQLWSSEKAIFDIVLMDVSMNRLDGDAATRIVRERESRRPERGHTRIVAVTA
jgi:CheY-like chemotaxis protein